MILLPGCLGGRMRAPWRRAHLPAVLIAILIASLATNAFAQDSQDQGSDQGQDQGSQQGAQAPAKESDSFIGRLRINPSYTSSVNTNRTQHQWDQTFSLHKEVQQFVGDNSWNMSLQKDSARNNYRARLGTSKTHLAYTVPGLGGLSAGTDLEFKRNFTGSKFDRTVSNGTTNNLFLSSELLGLGLNRAVGLTKDQLSWTVTGSDGLTSSKDIRQRWNQSANSSELTQTGDDSTTTTGSSPSFDSELKLAPSKLWNLDLNGNLGSSHEDSRTVSFKPGVQAMSIQKATNRNTNRHVAANSAFTFDPKNHATLSGDYLTAVNQYFQNYGNVQGQETKNGISQTFNLDVTSVPLWGMELDLKGQSSLVGANYKLAANQNRSARKNDVSGSLKFTTGSAWSWLQKIESTTEWDFQKTRNTAASTGNYNYGERRMRESLRRPLGSKVMAMITGEGTLGQSFYDDHSKDSDELRVLADGNLGYRPTKNLDTRLEAQYTQRKTVNIPAATAAQSNTENTYVVGAQVNLPLTSDIQLSQKYTMTADYSFYNFNEENNGLVRTTEVRTGLNSTVGTKVKLQIDHDYRFKDAGSYIRSAPGEPRAYTKASKERYQYLVVTTSYDFSQEFDLHASERLEVRRTTPIGVKVQPTTISRKSQFQGGAQLNHKFSDEFTVNASADNVRSSSERMYWMITASLNRKF